MYKVKDYEDIVEISGSDTQKRFEMIRKLSAGFTVRNDTALKMDQLLVEQLKAEQREDSNKSPIKKKVSLRTKPSSESGSSKAEGDFSEIEKSFEDLFDSIKEHHSRESKDFNPAQIREAVSKALKDSKIGLEQLDEELREKLSAKPRIIRYELPDLKLPDFEKPPIKTFQSIVDDVLMGNNILLVGGAGTGKTYLAEQLVSRMALGREYLTINCSQWTSPTEIIGGQTMDGYVEGKLIEAWANGYVLILDELPKIDPNTAGLFNDALAKTKLPEAIIFNARKESFKKHKNFTCIATGNIYPDKESITYGANNRQDLSLLDRFSGSVYFIEKNPEIERKIIANDMLWSICNQLRDSVEQLKYEAQLSLRFMQNARDSYALEMLRLQEKNKKGIEPNEGKNFKTAIDNYLSVFTEIQQKNLKDKIRYNDLLKNYQYRNSSKDILLF